MLDLIQNIYYYYFFTMVKIAKLSAERSGFQVWMQNALKKSLLIPFRFFPKVWGGEGGRGRGRGRGKGGVGRKADTV